MTTVRPADQVTGLDSVFPHRLAWDWLRSTQVTFHLRRKTVPPFLPDIAVASSTHCGLGLTSCPSSVSPLQHNNTNGGRIARL
jgi:hypothetical protein